MQVQWWCTFALVLALGSTGSGAQGEGQTISQLEARNYLKPVANFVVQILQKVMSEVNGNFVASHKALTSCLNLIYEASAGDTKQILMREIGLPSEKRIMRAIMNDMEKKMRPAIGLQHKYKSNSRFFIDLRRQVREEFVAFLTKYYRTSGVERVDFSQQQFTCDKINFWVDNSTDGAITTIVRPDDLNVDTSVMLVHTEYFKGSWKIPFDPDLTMVAGFHVTREETLQTPFMFSKAVFQVYKSPAITLLRLPYDNSNASMVIAVPPRGQAIHDVSLLIEQASTNFGSPIECEIFLPKFKVELDIDLTDSFKQMEGLKGLFDGQLNLGKMSPGQPLSIDKISQTVVVQVDEKGSTAAAAQTMMISSRMFIPNKCVINVNRPFYFLISSGVYSEVPLFLGRIVRPIT